MTYLTLHNNTLFPRGDTKDFATYCNLLREKWRRLYPLLKYYQLDYNPTVTSKVDENIKGEAPGTVFDRLYGEAVPAKESQEGFIQPHSTSEKALNVDATEGKKWKEVIGIHAFPLVNATDQQLQQYGISEMKDLVFWFTTPLLDDIEVTIRIGDVIDWDGELFEIVQYFTQGRWKRTNMSLFVFANTKRIKRGS